MTTKKPGEPHPQAHFVSRQHIPLLRELRLRELDEEYARQIARLRHILETVKRKHLDAKSKNKRSNQ